ncbi:MAG: ROK family protein [Spirochaetia bacterium]|jgi:glucokinase|nr:ROK family protein [Spirochaetia bacterium]
MDKYFAGIDIGGQSLKGIVLDQAGILRIEAVRSTPAGEGRQAVLRCIADLVEELSSLGALSSVGAGTPGGVDKRGVVVGMAANISGWAGTGLGEALAAMAAAPCVVRNDANMAAYAEWGARFNTSSALLFIGLGTGIGGGFIEDGRILGGCNDRAVELGHSIVEPGGRSCACGVSGCAEAYASGPSIGRIAVDLALGRDARLGSMEPRDIDRSFAGSRLAARARAGELLNARDVYAAYAQGDPLAVCVDAVAAAALARSAATGLALLAPDTLVLGGGVIEGAPHLCSSIQAQLPGLVYGDGWKGCRVEKARFLQKAGLYGAALYGAAQAESREELTALAARAMERSGLVG